VFLQVVRCCFPGPCSSGPPLISILFVIGFFVGVPVVIYLVDKISPHVKGDNENDTETISE
jgi:hypothetical protein